MTAHRIVVVDGHPLYREALHGALSEFFEDSVVTEVATEQELSDLLDEKSNPCLVLFSLSTPAAQGLTSLMQLRAQYPKIKLVAVSPQGDQATMRSCLDIGLAGFIPKSLPAEAIREAVEQILQGNIWSPPELASLQEEDRDIAGLATKLATLTPQQVRVLTMLSEGLLNKQIAYQLGVSEATVKAHVSAILQKLDVDSRTQAVIAVNKLGSRDWQQAAL
jgi:DNA-binding NarL/FixJ family response regulator